MHSTFYRKNPGLWRVLPIFALVCFGNSLDVSHLYGEAPLHFELQSGEMQKEPVSEVYKRSLQEGRIEIVHPVWDFYWMQLLSPEQARKEVPSRRIRGMDIWKKLGYSSSGYATYRTLIPVPRNIPLAFRLSQQLTSVRVFIDGEAVAVDGSPAISEQETLPARGNLIIEHTSQSGMIELVLHIANFHSFRGGARGMIQVGPVDEVRESRNLQRSLELLASGFLGSIALYHLFLFALQRRQWVYLIFALTCLSFALRIPLLGEKTIHEILPGLSWEVQYRSNMSLNIVTPPFLLLFFHRLFPAALNRKLFYGFLIVCGAFSLSIFLDTISLGRIMFAYYLVAAGPALLLGFYMALVYGIRQKGSGRTMAVGMGLVSILGVMAIYQNWYTRDYAGQLAILAFVSFGFFQAIGVAQRHNESIEKEKMLGLHLERSRQALSYQRQSLENDLHDNLGSRLVDLKLESARINEAGLSGLRKQIEEINQLFRGQLLFIEDLEYSSRDPITGIQLSILRRYSSAGRELKFRISEKDRAMLDSQLQDDSFRMEFLQITREICTNDLKYGVRDSRWRISIDKDRCIRLLQLNRIRSEDSTPGPEWSGVAAEDEPGLSNASSEASGPAATNQANPIRGGGFGSPESWEASGDSENVWVKGQRGDSAAAPEHLRRRARRLNGTVRKRIIGAVFAVQITIPGKPDAAKIT